MEYEENDMLMLSGIQHFMFCPRQWALIHIDQQWEENKLTIEGEILHKNVDNPFYREKNAGCITLHSINISSKELGLYGITDAVELHPTDSLQNSIKHSKYEGLWIPYPIEYKRGHKKSDERDIVQLVAQIMCIEEMYSIHINSGALYYGETRRREEIYMNDELRNLVKYCSCRMHEIFNSHILPDAVYKSHCKSCSLYNICLPEISKCSKVSQYLKKNLYEEIA